jgi:ferric-dicitrate binding protein FerR (iron transport regulator)
MGIADFNGMEDLVFSRSFRDWVLNPDSAEREYWEHWIATHPDKVAMVNQARAMIYSLHVERTTPRDWEVEQEVRKAIDRLRDAPKYIPMDAPVRRTRRLRSLQVILAAAMAAGIFVAGYFYYRIKSQRDVLQTFLLTNRNHRIREQATLVADLPPLPLPDGSRVRLSKGSKLYYASAWPGDSTPREVYLEGEATFEISPHPASPFYVYTSRLISRALGTSFVMRAFPGETKATVTVLTGKLSVYRIDDFYADHSGGPRGLVLGRNQEAVEERQGDQLYRTVARMPELPEDRPDTGFVFCRTPVTRVFAKLEESYGIPIQLDGEAADSCLLTATLDNRSFYAKLNQICKAIGANYEAMDGDIVVTARGCQ